MQIKHESLTKELQKIGLTDKEALVYTSLLELGAAYPSRIAEYSGLKRATTYNILITLSVRGLVNEIEKRGKLFYQIEKPEKLLQYSRTRVKLAEESVDRVAKLLPDIEGIFSLIANKPKVLFFEGPDAVFSIYKDISGEKESYEMLAFSNPHSFRTFASSKQLKEVMDAKKRLHITTRGVVPDTPENRAYTSEVFEGLPEELHPKIRYMLKETFPYEGEILIYGKNKVAITKLGGGTLIGVIVEDTMIHGMMRTIFELSWNSTSVSE